MKVTSTMYLVDSDGIIVRELANGDRIVTKKQAESYKSIVDKEESEKVLPMKYTEFLTLNTRELRCVSDELDVYTWNVFTKLIMNVDFNTSLLCWHGEYDLTLGDLCEICGVERHKLAKCIKTLVQKYFMALVVVGKGTNKYLINPWFCIKGRYINANLKHIFGEYEVRSKGMKMWNDL